MKCCFIGYKDKFGNKKECKTIEDVIKKLSDSGVDEFYSRGGSFFEYMCEDGVKKTNSKLIYIHYCIETIIPILKNYYDFDVWLCFWSKWKKWQTGTCVKSAQVPVYSLYYFFLILIISPIWQSKAMHILSKESAS